MDKLTAIKIKYDDGTYSDEIPISVLSENVEWDSTHTLVDVLGSIDVDVTGTIQDQISQLFNEKVSNTQLSNYVASQLNIDVTNWLNTNVNPVGSAVIVDDSLSIEGAAADAKFTGEKISLVTDIAFNVFEDIGIEHKTSENLLNPEKIEQGRITSTSSLVNPSYDTYITTDFIEVEIGQKYGFYGRTSGIVVNLPIANIWAYDSNKNGINYLGKIDYNRDGLSYITIPNNTKFIRASITSDNYYSFGIVMFSKANGITPPEQIIPYENHYELTGFCKSEDLIPIIEDINDINTNIDNINANINNFIVKTWSPIEGTITKNKFIESTGIVTDISLDTYSINTIPVNSGEKYQVTGAAYYKKYYYGFYDNTNTFIDGLKASESGTTRITDLEITVPNNAVSLVVCAAFGEQAIIKNFSGQINKILYPWYNKKWVVIGDSLTENNVATTKHYFDYIAENTGITIHNMGVGGTGYIRGYNNNRAFYQRVLNIPTENIDIVTVFGSGNDMNLNASPIFDGKTWEEALGVFTDINTDTICGCINTFLNNYYSKHPTTPIGIIAPTPWKNWPTTLISNNRFNDYTKALQTICEYRGVPFLDLYHYSNLRPEDQTNCNACFYNGTSLDGNGDGVHPNELGHKIIASKIYEFLKTLL